MTKPDAITQNLLAAVADLHDTPSGAYNLRLNGESAGRRSTANIQIEAKQDKPGIDIRVLDGTKGETCHIPVIITQTGLSELVYNDFYIGEGADIIIVAGCGVHTDTEEEARHNGIHRFFVEKGAKVVYREKHIGTGDGSGKRTINPQTFAEISEGGMMEIDSTQIKGVDSTNRVTKAWLAAGAKLRIKEKIMTHGKQTAETDFIVELDGEDAAVDLVSRSVAKGSSRQLFRSQIVGNTRCTGHSECDAIIMDQGVVSAVPELTANHLDAGLIHEAAIGKIAGEQLIKLMTLGLTEAEAEAKIIEGFLK